jgi:hypothetical protein
MTLWLVSVALAQDTPPEPPPPSPARQCADAADGAEVEVCLGLAVQHPDDIDSIAAALVAHVDRREAGDRELLDAVLSSLDPERALDGIRLLGASDDPRALPPLVAIVQAHPDEALARAAVLAVAEHPDPIPQLRRWLSDADLPLARRIAAVHALAAEGSDQAADAVEDALRRPRQPLPLRQALLETLRTTWPARTPERGVVTADGSLWLAAGSAWNLGYAMGVAGHFGRTDLAAVGALTGATAGSTAGYLYGRAWPMEAGEAAMLSTASVGGTTAGMLVGASMGEGTPDELLLGGLAGQVAGVGLGLALRTTWSGTSVDAVEGLAVGGLSALATDGVLQFRDEVRGTRDGQRVLATGVALGLGGVVGHGVSPFVRLERSDGWLVAATAAGGLGVGLLLPTGGRRRVGLPAAGLSVGTLAGYGLAGVLDPEPATLAAAGTGSVFGGVAGYGVGLLASDEPDVRGAATLVGGAAGATIGAIGGQLDPDPIDDRDVILSGAATAWATWQVVAIGQTTTVSDGFLVLTPPVVGAATTLASNYLDVPVTHTLAASSVGLWGGYAGGVTGELLDQDVLLFAMVGSDVGLAGGALVMSPLVGLPPLVVGIADAGGVAGASLGALVAAQLDDDDDVIVAVSLGGAATGLALGAALGTVWHREGSRRDVALSLPMLKPPPGRWSLAPLPVQTDGKPGGGLRVTIDRW